MDCATRHSYHNMEIRKYLGDGVSQSFDCIKGFSEITIAGTTFTFEYTDLYVEITMGKKAFFWNFINPLNGAVIELFPDSVIRHYSWAFIRLVRLFAHVDAFNRETKTTHIDFTLSNRDMLQYNLPTVLLNLQVVGKDVSCTLHSYLLSEIYWLRPTPEEYEMRPNPYSTGQLYYLTATGMTPLAMGDLNLLIEKMLKM